MPHFPKHYDLGPHCQLVHWLTKFESEDPDANGNPVPVLDQWTIRRIYASPLLSDSSGEGIISMMKRKILNAALAVPKLDGRPYVTAVNAHAILSLITAYENSSSANKNQSFSYFFVNPPAVGDDEHTLFESLCYKGVYIPPFHRSPNASDTPAIEKLLYGNSATGVKPIWDFAFPDPNGGNDTTFGAITFEVLFTTAAKLLYNRYRDTFFALKSARELGILRVSADRPLSLCGTPDGSLADAIVATTFNGKCCGPYGCQTATTPFMYCSEISPGVCSAVSDICLPSS